MAKSFRFLLHLPALLLGLGQKPVGFLFLLLAGSRKLGRAFQILVGCPLGRFKHTVKLQRRLRQRSKLLHSEGPLPLLPLHSDDPRLQRIHGTLLLHNQLDQVSPTHFL